MRYTVWSDSESAVEVHKEFDNIEAAEDFAIDFVHRYDGDDADRVIAHVEDNEAGETVSTFENRNKCDYHY